MNDISTITIGSQAIEFKLISSTGGEIALSDYLHKKNVYLFFVRAFK